MDLCFDKEKAEPGNKNIRPKIRWQLQILKDRGILK